MPPPLSERRRRLAHCSKVELTQDDYAYVDSAGVSQKVVLSFKNGQLTGLAAYPTAGLRFEEVKQTIGEPIPHPEWAEIQAEIADPNKSHAYVTMIGVSIPNRSRQVLHHKRRLGGSVLLVWSELDDARALNDENAVKVVFARRSSANSCGLLLRELQVEPTPVIAWVASRAHTRVLGRRLRVLYNLD